MARRKIHPCDLILLTSISVYVGTQTLTQGFGIAMAIANAIMGFLVGWGDTAPSEKSEENTEEKATITGSQDGLYGI